MWLTLVALVPAAADDDPRIPELEIRPGFYKEEIVESTRATLTGARACLDGGVTLATESLDGEDLAYVTARRVDGRAVALQVRRAEVHCRAWPLTRCTFLSAVDPTSTDVGYANIDCRGSRRGHEDGYGLTATRDVQGAAGGGPEARKGKLKLSLSFVTSTFPGTQVSAFAMLRRRDRAVLEPVAVVQFTDYHGMDDPLYDVLDVPTLEALLDDVVALADEGTRARGPASTPEP